MQLDLDGFLNFTWRIELPEKHPGRAAGHSCGPQGGEGNPVSERPA